MPGRPQGRRRSRAPDRPDRGRLRLAGSRLHAPPRIGREDPYPSRAAPMSRRLFRSSSRPVEKYPQICSAAVIMSVQSGRGNGVICRPRGSELDVFDGIRDIPGGWPSAGFCGGVSGGRPKAGPGYGLAMPVSSSAMPLPAVRRFTSARAGLAYAVMGAGDRPAVVIPGWVSHIDYDLLRPEICSFYQRLACGCVILLRQARLRTVGSNRRGERAGEAPPRLRMRSRSWTRRECGAWLSWPGRRVGRWQLPWPRVTRSGFPALSFTARTRGSWPPPITRAGQPPEVVQSLRLLVLAEWGLGSRLLANVVVSETDPGFATWFTGYLRSAKLSRGRGRPAVGRCRE